MEEDSPTILEGDKVGSDLHEPSIANDHQSGNQPEQFTSDSGDSDLDPDTTIEMMHLADELGLVARPSSRNKVSKSRRYLVQTPKAKSLIKMVKEKIFKLREEGSHDEDIKALEGSLLLLEYMQPPGLPPTKHSRRTPVITNISTAFESLNRDLYLFAQIFSGFEPFEVMEMSQFLLPPRIKTSHHGHFSCEMSILIVLARFRLSISTWEVMGHYFSADPSLLCDLFCTATQRIYDEWSDLLGIDSILNLPKKLVKQSKSALLRKYRKNIRNKNANFPKGYEDVGAILDCSRFTICRPGKNSDSIQRSYYSGHIKAHNINLLLITLPNGLRIYADVASGRHADPYMISKTVVVLPSLSYLCYVMEFLEGVTLFDL